MLTERNLDINTQKLPTCPNCGGNMMPAMPDEFFETYAYYCEECGIRTKECNTLAEAYATIKRVHKEI